MFHMNELFENLTLFGLIKARFALKLCEKCLDHRLKLAKETAYFS